MGSHLAGQEAYILAQAFVYVPTLCVKAAMALVRLPICTDSSEPWLYELVHL